jgi:hypothetical protein
MKLTLPLLSAFLLLLPLVTNPVSSAPPVTLNTSLFANNDGFSLLKQERIGKLQIGLAEEEVYRIVTSKCAMKAGLEKLWGADGAYHQEWDYPNCGITLSMVSNQKGGSKSIESITLVRPSRLSTKRGIRIGSTEKVVKKAYKAEWNRETNNSESFVAGSIYGGLIFQFQNGKVSKIFLGAAAE